MKNSKKTYKVLFKGIILPGFDKTQVIENIHKLTTIPVNIITRKFFSGKTVVIRHADNKYYAEQLQTTFTAAGIQTAIEETLTDDDKLSRKSEVQSSKKFLSSDNSPTNTAKIIKTAFVKLSYVTALTVAMVLIYFLYDPGSKQTVIQQPENIVKKSLVPKKTKVIIREKQAVKSVQSESEFFLSSNQINTLTKITDTVELERLSQFLPLLNIDSAYLEFIKQELSRNDSSFTLSTNKPLYVYNTKQHNGIVVGLKNKLSKAVTQKIQERLNFIQNKTFQGKEQSNQACPENNYINLHITDNVLLLTSLKNKKKLKLLQNIIENNELLIFFLTLDNLFHHVQEVTGNTFSFYYNSLYSKLISSNSNTEQSNYLALSVQEDTFLLSPGEQFLNSSRGVFEVFDIKINKKLQLTSLKLPLQNLYNLTLLLIGQNYPSNFSKYSSSTNSSSPITEPAFTQEEIIPIKPEFSAKNIKPYENNLDVELQAQWQSGPFAIAVNNYEFDSQLVIELLAKGQNIHNMIEYSRSAKLNTYAVYNTENKDIYDKECLIPQSDPQHSEKYFKNLDGEQEAYINDDFVTYHTIIAKNRIKIQANHNLQEIAQIEGEISLQLPGEILQKTLKKPYHHHYAPFDHFIMFFNIQPDDTTVSYQVSDKADHFITLRAYNESGEVLETTSFKQQIIINKLLKKYEQSFSEPIAIIRVFYTNQREVLSYPFTLKPEILPVTTALSQKDVQPIIYDSTELDFKPLSDQALSDNLQWLGNQVAEKDIPPFHISLFALDSINNYIDAVLNIKTSVTPLISQNITAVKVSLTEVDKTVLDNFVAFSENALPGNDFTQRNNSADESPEIESYLNANSALQLKTNHPDNIEKIKGIITLSLPTSYKTHSSKYLSPGQIIKLDEIFVKLIKVTRQQVQFEIKGEIENLVQLKLYNEKKELISKPLEFIKHIQKDKAYLTLLYNNQIDTIKLVLAKTTTRKEYPFSFANKQ